MLKTASFRTGLLLLSIILSATCYAATMGPRYGLGEWQEKGHGNHRAVVRVTEPAEAVRAEIEWRRRDAEPETKGIIVEDLATGKRITNAVAVQVTRERGDIIFQPETVPGDYAVYYLPYTPRKSTFDKEAVYFKPENTADPAWAARVGVTSKGSDAAWQGLPKAELVEIQARNAFHRFDPMEVVATKAEVAALLARHPGASYLLFPEDRRYAVRMFDDLPLRWIESGSQTQFEGAAQPDEYYPFQIAVFAARTALEDIRLDIGEFRSASGAVLPASAFTCFNLEGTDWLGRPMTKRVDIGRGKTRPLWLGVQIPRDAKGPYRGQITVRPSNAPATPVQVTLSIDGAPLDDHGDSELWRLSRLRWLNSTVGMDDDVVAPYTPLVVKGDSVACLNRVVTFGPEGLPASITSNGREILARPIQLHVETGAGPVKWTDGASRNAKVTPGTVEREAAASAPGLRLNVQTKMEFEGYVGYRAVLTAEAAVDLRDVQLLLPVRPEAARYMMGMGQRGGTRPAEFDWKWDIAHADNALWLGDVDAGLQVELKGPEDVWQIVDLKKSGVPESWGNGGRGGCKVREENEAVLARVFTGARHLEAGEAVEFRFQFLITPFKPIDPEHWNWRIGDVSRQANIGHIHHATAENPFINYPFLTVDKLSAAIAAVKSVRTREIDPGTLMYPAQGNMNLAQGALHVWTRLAFDPTAGKARQAEFNQGLFRTTSPNGDEVCLYWNVDVRGMRAYVRKGPPSKNQYPVMIDAPLPGWRQGDRHVVTLSWGEAFEIFVDGKRCAHAAYSGTLDGPQEAANMVFEGKGFAMDVVKCVNAPFKEGAPLRVEADAQTLLLDTFTGWDGGAETRPERSAGAGPGTARGVCKRETGAHGNEILFATRTVDTGEKGVNVYYTVRELTNHVAEMWVLRSLGDEVFETGESFIYFDDKAETKTAGGGDPWLREHLVTGYVPAWHQRVPGGEMDAAFATQGLSRWHNYYLEGLDWLMTNTGMDGLYLDGIGYDRKIMKRVSKVMLRNNPKSRINFHSGNNYDYQNWHVNPANTYMGHLPFMSNLWIGEMYDYDRSADYWLVEISGIPFGLTSEMLNYQNGGNAYRGMLYGMTGRFHPSHEAMWRFWDSFGIQQTEMIGYWDSNCPVQTNSATTLATVYRKDHEALIALANWPTEAGAAEQVQLEIDWKALGMDGSRAQLTAPAIDHFQDAQEFDPRKPIPVEPKKGWLLILREE